MESKRGLMVYVVTEERVKLSDHGCMIAFGGAINQLETGADVFIFDKNKKAIVSHGIFTGERLTLEDNQAIYREECKDTWDDGVRTHSHTHGLNLPLTGFSFGDKYYNDNLSKTGRPKMYVEAEHVDEIKDALKLA